MDLVELVRMLRRHLALTCALGLVLAAALGVVAVTVPAQFRAVATVLTIRQGGEGDGNPYAVVAPSQPQAATLVVTRLTSPQGKQELAAAGARGEIEVDNTTESTEQETPFVTVVVTADTRAVAMETADLVTTQARTVLRGQQRSAGAPPDRQLLLADVVEPVTATTSRAAQLRALAVSGALGLVLVVATIAITDRVRGRRPTTITGAAAHTKDTTAQSPPATRTDTREDPAPDVIPDEDAPTKRIKIRSRSVTSGGRAPM